MSCHNLESKMKKITSYGVHWQYETKKTTISGRVNISSVHPDIDVR